MIRKRTALLAALLAAPLAVHGAQNIVTNGSMESGGGPNAPDPRIPLNWTLFGGTTVERSDQENLVPPDGEWSLKIFGGASTVGAYQDVAAAAGDMITISAQLYSRSTDKIRADAQAKIRIEFYDDMEQEVGTAMELVVMNESTAADTWIPGSIGPVAAPTGTAVARMVCVWTFPSGGTSLGSAYWDDCSLTINGGGNLLVNPDFEQPGFSEQSPFGIDDWTGFGDQEKTDAAAFHGNSSVQIHVPTPSGGSFSGLFQETRELTAGDRLFAQCRMLHTAPAPLSGSAAAAIKLEFYPAEGIELPPPEELLSFDENSPQDTWVPVTLNTVVPANATLARCVMIAVDDSSTNGAVYMDSAFAERGSQPGVNQLLNESFEDGTSGVNGLTNWEEFRGLGCQARKNNFEVPADDGTFVLKISGSCVAGVLQDVEVTPGEAFSLSALVRSRSSAPFDGPNAMCGVKVEWVSGGIPDQIDIGDAPNNTADSATPQDTWVPLFIDYTMPAGSAAGVRLVTIVSKGSAEDVTVFFDACEAVVLNQFDGADVDGDGDEDLADFARFQECFSGSGVTPLGWPCIVFDNDDDEDIDINDYNYFQPRLTGP